MDNDTILETERLIIRKLNEADIEPFFQLGKDPDVLRFLGEDGFSTRDEALKLLRERPFRDYERYGYGRWACVLKEGNEFIGWCGLKYMEDLEEVDLGYRFFPRFWGKGYGTEAALACVKYGFEVLGLKRMVGIAMPENTGSRRILEKCGLSYDGMMEYDGIPVARYVIEGPGA